MSKTLKEVIYFLDLIAQIKRKRLREEVLADLSSNDKLYKALHEIALNVKNRKIKLSQEDKGKLRKYYSTIEELASKKIPDRRRKNLIVQSGGFLPYIIPLVFSALSSIINGTQ